MEAESTAAKIDRLHLQLHQLEQQWLKDRTDFLDRHGKEPLDTFNGRYLAFFILMTLSLIALNCITWAPPFHEHAKIFFISLAAFVWICFWLNYGKIQHRQFLEAKAQHDRALANLEQELVELRQGINSV